ncbi:hypothetical protein [Mycolicibacterium nivoides]|uniref:Uncharacterized protein n=1 Tax=Mycolicibacterium nivoides TaxID=2487344 RepID=A0ABW9LJT8_9MYCO
MVYDTTCLITGVNLRGIDATAVLLRRTRTGQYFPISLGIRGAYDGFGSIEGIAADLNTRLLTRFFTAAYRNGRFLAHDPTHTGDPVWFDPDITIESLLYLVERTTTHADLYGGSHPPSTVLDGDPVVLTMIAQPVWDALTSQQSRWHPLITAAFPSTITGTEIYGAHVHELADPMRQLATISAFIGAQKQLRWAPPGEPEQRYPRGVGRQYSDAQNRGFVAAARRDYRANPAIQAALDTYIKAVD